MRKLIFISAVLIIPLQTFCQNFSFDIYAGFGLYQLKDLKDFQIYEKNSFNRFFPVKEVERFPGYFNYSIAFEYKLSGKNIVGFNGTFYTTGARNHIEDYSGEYKLDMILNGYRLGLQYRNLFSTLNKIKIYGQIKSGLIISSLKMNTFLNIYNVSSNSSSYTYISKTFFVEPSFGTKYAFKNRISFDFNVGYQIDTKGKLYSKKYKEITLQGLNGGNVLVDWTGLRVLLGFSYELFWK